jgi:hypothetical protein
MKVKMHPGGSGHACHPLWSERGIHAALCGLCTALVLSISANRSLATEVQASESSREDVLTIDGIQWFKFDEVYPKEWPDNVILPEWLYLAESRSIVLKPADGNPEFTFSMRGMTRGNISNLFNLLTFDLEADEWARSIEVRTTDGDIQHLYSLPQVPESCHYLKAVYYRRWEPGSPTFRRAILFRIDKDVTTELPDGLFLRITVFDAVDQ